MMAHIESTSEPSSSEDDASSSFQLQMDRKHAGQVPDSSTSSVTLARQYNPNENYGFGNNVQRARQYTPYTRCAQRSVSTSQARTTASANHGRATCAVSTTMKEVILLLNPSEREVPKYAKKALLHENGFVVDAVEIDRSWSEKELREKCEVLFASKLKGIG